MSEEFFDSASRESILVFAKQLEGRTIADLDLPARKPLKLGKGKGQFGNFVEYVVFGVAPNNREEPDLPSAGVEIKIAPLVKKPRAGVVPKERMVLGIIDFHSMLREQFPTSKFLRKNRCILALFFFWRSRAKPRSLRFERVQYIEFAGDDLAVIRGDWEKIRRRIANGEAHLLSEGDTLYLGACTKGASSKTMRTQPKSRTPARQRAFALKTSYIKILRSRSKNLISIVPKVKRKRLDIEGFVESKLSRYIGLSDQEIARRLAPEIDKKAKSFHRILVNRMLGLSGKQRALELEKADVTIRAVRVEEDGDIEQSISFRTIRFDDLVDTDEWEESEFYGEIARRFLFCVFKKKSSDGPYYFLGSQFWGMPFMDLEEARKVWMLTRRYAATGDEKSFPKSKENRVAHVRPKGKKGDSETEFRGRVLKKKCFWINRKYVIGVIGRLFGKGVTRTDLD